MRKEWRIHYFKSVQRKPKEAALYEWRMKWWESTDWWSGVRILQTDGIARAKIWDKNKWWDNVGPCRSNDQVLTWDNIRT